MKSKEEGQKLNKHMRLKDNTDISKILDNQKNTNESTGHTRSFKNVGSMKEIELDSIKNSSENKFAYSRMDKNIPISRSSPIEYLKTIEHSISTELISSKNYTKIKNFSHYFPNDITSFFGFESRINSHASQSDYIFAVSSKGGERESFFNLIKTKNLPSSFYKKSEWKQIGDFTQTWVDPKSVLYEKILGVWFEFDFEELYSNAPIPNIFIHLDPVYAFSPRETSPIRWLTDLAIPLLLGQRISKLIEEKMMQCIYKLPPQASIFQVGVMLARSSSGVRLAVKRIQPDEIIPYLNTIGWTDEDNQLFPLIQEIKKHVTRVVLNINVTEKIDKKIGIECSFYPDLYNKESKWSDFLAFLTKKGLCLPEKKSALLHFPGAAHDELNNDDAVSFMSVVKIPTNDFSSTLVRYISHIKISYEPNHPLEVKAYSGVRLFGYLYPSKHDSSKKYKIYSCYKILE